MSIPMLVELWEGIKTYIPVKERQEVADILVEKFDDYSMLDGAVDYHEMDRILKESLSEFVDEGDESCED